MTEYGRGRETALASQETERFGSLAHEQRNLLSAAMLAFQMLRSGAIGISGSTGAVLERSLLSLRSLSERSLAETRLDSGSIDRVPMDVATFIEGVEVGAILEAKAKSVQLTVVPALPGCSVLVDPHLLYAAVGNLLGNAFMYTPPGGHVSLRTRLTETAAGPALASDVEDQCGDLSPGLHAGLFRPFERRGRDRSGLGLGLQICRKAWTVAIW